MLILAPAFAFAPLIAADVHNLARSTQFARSRTCTPGETMYVGRTARSRQGP